MACPCCVTYIVHNISIGRYSTCKCFVGAIIFWFLYFPVPVAASRRVAIVTARGVGLFWFRGDTVFVLERGGGEGEGYGKRWLTSCVPLWRLLCSRHIMSSFCWYGHATVKSLDVYVRHVRAE